MCVCVCACVSFFYTQHVIPFLCFRAKKDGVDYDFETVHNLDIYGCELAPTTKQGLRSWNMTVQYWLATYIHRRVPPSLKPYRSALVFTGLVLVTSALCQFLDLWGAQWGTTKLMLCFTHTHMHACTHRHTRRHVHAYTHTYMHAHTQRFIYTHWHIYT